jgi:hypothetical protein
MKIRMLRTERSSPDGIRVETYEAGKKYDFPENRALAFIAAGWAEEDKDMGGAPETKTEDHVPPPIKGRFLRRK